MKTRLLALVISALLPMLCAAGDTNGFLVFKIERFAYGAERGAGTNAEMAQSFKIPLTPEFLSNFKNLPNQNSSGSGFHCGSHFANAQNSDPGFLWWLEKTTTDHRWYIHMWSFFRNPGITQSVTIKNLEDLDMSYQDSYVNKPGNGVNVSFTAKYMSAEELQREAPIPTAAVKKADRSVLFAGDSLTNCPVVLSGSFQEN